jgi:energy-coupling factor transporter ATPase
VLDQVGVRYPDQPADGPWALQGVNLRVARGEFVAVLGGNGSGKSTLAALLGGLLLPTVGRVTVAGLDTADPRAAAEIRRRVGLVFQNPDNQIVAAVVEDDVAFGPENLGLPPEEIGRRVREALEAVGLREYARADPHRLSGGQKQRLAIAGALAMRPDCLCLDEPTSLLDPVGRAEVLRALHGLHARGCALVLITHHSPEAVRADRVVVLSRGRIVADGPPREVLGQAERLQAWGVEPPPPVAAWAALRAHGLELPGPPLTLEDLVEALAARRRAGRCLPRRAAPARGGAGPRGPPGARGGARPTRGRFTFPDLSPGRHRPRPAVDGVDLELLPGQCVALLGTTGSGKSTVAMHCCALLQPEAGSVEVDGLRPWSLRGAARARALQAVRRRAGMVFQHPEEQFFEERVLDEVAFAPLNHGASTEAARAAAEAALRRVGLEPESFGHRSPFRLSGGEMRRVAIASLLAARPRYLLLDEPTAGLDAAGRAEVLALVRSLKAEGIGCLYVTHRMDEAAALADRVAVLAQGRIVAQGQPSEVFVAGPGLAGWGLEPPPAVQWLAALRAQGWPVPPYAATLEEAVVHVLDALGGPVAGRPGPAP